MNRETLAIKRRAQELGFTAVGIAPLGENPHAAELDRWLAAGYAGTMTYLHRQAEKRKDPRRVMPEARCAIVTLTNYYHGSGGVPSAPARIAQYAWSTDYHDVIGARLEQLAREVTRVVPGARTRAYVDAGPLPERELARLAGLGWIGKNMMLINPGLGSFTFIGVVLVDAPLTPDEPFATDHCGTCRRCLDACPTQAFVAAGELDARRCISYLTIERRGPLDDAEQAMLGEWVFGCDVCQDVCPWNVKFAQPTSDTKLAPRPELSAPSLDELGSCDDAEFTSRFGDTPLARAGAGGMRRNVAAVSNAHE